LMSGDDMARAVQGVCVFVWLCAFLHSACWCPCLFLHVVAVCVRLSGRWVTLPVTLPCVVIPCYDKVHWNHSWLSVNQMPKSPCNEMPHGHYPTSGNDSKRHISQRACVRSCFKRHCLLPVVCYWNVDTVRDVAMHVHVHVSFFASRGKPQPPFDLVQPALQRLAQLIYSKDDEVLTDACWALSYLSGMYRAWHLMCVRDCISRVWRACIRFLVRHIRVRVPCSPPFFLPRSVC
jgi:hypothetical protein